MKERFGHAFSALLSLQNLFISKRVKPKLAEIASFISLTQHFSDEWKVLRKNPRDLSTLVNQVEISTSFDFQSMFPLFSQVTRTTLLLSVSTASVERSFSTMNRLLDSLRSNLLACHLDALMRISIEGPEIPDVLTASSEEESAFAHLLDLAATETFKSSHRF